MRPSNFIMVHSLFSSGRMVYVVGFPLLPSQELDGEKRGMKDDDDDTGLSNRNPLDRIMGSGASDIQQGEGEKRTGREERWDC